MARWNKTAKWKRARAASIVARDGRLCWLCNRPIASSSAKQGRRASIEHLQARCLGGGNELGNLVLCHNSCNRHLGSRPAGRAEVEDAREMACGNTRPGAAAARSGVDVSPLVGLSVCGC
jgi:5-methylcytosine-specific restriction endonuclease McrA